MSLNTNAVLVTDKEEKDGIISAFRSAVKAYSYFFHVVFLECCQFVDVRPAGLQIKNEAFIKFDSKDMSVFWDQTISSTEQSLLETLLYGIVGKLVNFEIHFWNSLPELEENTQNFDDIIDWWVKLVRYLEKEEIF